MSSSTDTMDDVDRLFQCFKRGVSPPRKIRSWYWFPEYGLIVYSMSRNRYCEGIGGQRKSNHGYRSPFRPIPIETICIFCFPLIWDRWSIMEVFTHNKNKYQFVNNYEEQDLLYADGHDTESCAEDSRWIEAIKVADDIENKQKTWELSNVVNTDDEDNSWWTAVEQTASQAELMHCK